MAIVKNYSMKEDTVKRLEKYAKKKELKMSVVVDEALKEYLDKKEAK